MRFPGICRILPHPISALVALLEVFDYPGLGSMRGGACPRAEVLRPSPLPAIVGELGQRYPDPRAGLHGSAEFRVRPPEARRCPDLAPAPKRGPYSRVSRTCSPV